jgi:hypothetical protein
VELDVVRPDPVLAGAVDKVALGFALRGRSAQREQLARA